MSPRMSGSLVDKLTTWCWHCWRWWRDYRRICCISVAAHYNNLYKVSPYYALSTRWPRLYTSRHARRWTIYCIIMATPGARAGPAVINETIICKYRIMGAGQQLCRIWCLGCLKWRAIKVSVSRVPGVAVSRCPGGRRASSIITTAGHTLVTGDYNPKWML